MTTDREACYITPQDLGIAGNVLKIRANFWRGFLGHFCLEAENVLVFAVLGACRMSSPGFADFRVLKHVDLKARNCIFC